MTEPSTGEICDLLARVMADSPEPHPWADVEQRTQQGCASPPQRRTGVWLTAAACTIALMGGLVAVVGSGDEPKLRTEDPDSTTASTTASTSAPVPAPTTAPRAEPGWIGGLLDDIDVDILRPLDGSFNSFEGDIVVPTAPSDWRVENAGFSRDDPLLYPDVNAWFVDVAEAPTDDQSVQRIYLRMSQFPVCIGCRSSGESATINGLAWESILLEQVPEADDRLVDATVLRARLDNDSWLSIVVSAPQLLNGPPFENPLIIEFLQGLRVSSWDEIVATDN